VSESGRYGDSGRDRERGTGREAAREGVVGGSTGGGEKRIL